MPVFAFLLVLVGFVRAETLYAADAVKGVRWPDSSFSTLELEKGDELEVLARDGSLVRVRRGGDFGWVPASALVVEKPAMPVEISLPPDAGGAPIELKLPPPPPASPAPVEPPK